MLLPDDVEISVAPEETGPDAGMQLAFARERIRHLEELVSLEREWLITADMTEGQRAAATSRRLRQIAEVTNVKRSPN